MRLFHCAVCAQPVYFENSLCLGCGSALGFEAARRDIVTLQPEEGAADGVLRIVGDGGVRHRCANAELARCNWLVAQPGGLCEACALTATRPADDDADGLRDFAAAEEAKRRLLFTVLDLGLPVVSFRDEPDGGLAFRLLSSDGYAVTTGHADGVITLDLDEADAAHRERLRAELDEPYRTVLGHLRHEIGHYYWPILVEQAGLTDAFRALFGDERADYGAALDRHYADGPPADWAAAHVSAYATMHPWEDWAETWAHYLHITDGAQTAAAHGLTTHPAPVPAADFAATLDAWVPLSVALNGMARSLGLGDLYPFVLPLPVREKLAFIHRAVTATVDPHRPAADH